MYRYFTAILSSLLLSHFSINGSEIRATVDDTKNIQLAMPNIKAAYIGYYSFTDHIYVNKDCDDLNNEFVRVRVYLKTNWQQKNVVVAHKLKDFKKNCHQILFKEECDTLEQAESYVPENFYKKFSFSRHGWEYTLENMHIYIEEIEGLSPSIEVIGPAEEISKLFKSLNVSKILTDSVPAWYNKINSH